jgi:hypothetical protein
MKDVRIYAGHRDRNRVVGPCECGLYIGATTWEDLNRVCPECGAVVPLVGSTNRKDENNG